MSQESQQSIAVPAQAGKYGIKEVKFNFRKNAELGTKRPSITLPVKVLTLQGLVSILESGDEKQVNLILETLQNPIIEQARAQVDENESITAETIDSDKLSWEFIANLEPATRRGGGIPKEVWEAFVLDYTEVMPGATGKNAEQVGRAAGLLGNKFAAVKTNKKVLNFLDSQLDLYFSTTAKADEFIDCYEFLKSKAATLLAASDEALLANL